MAEQQTGLTKVIFIVISIAVIAMMLLILAIIFNVIPLSSIFPTFTSSSNAFILFNNVTQPILASTGEGITSNFMIRNNDTWLNFDGDDDNVLSERHDTISFWYKNETVDWTFVVNSSGTLYVNGSLGTPGVYPVYDDGSNMFLYSRFT